MEVKPTKLYRLIEIPPYPHQRMFLPKVELQQELFLHGSRLSTVSESYIGTFSTIYRSGGYIIPKGERFDMLMDYVAPIND